MTINYPNSLDDDSTLPRVDGNITEVGDEAINATRSAIFSIEEEVGIGGKGNLSSIADRIAVSLDDDGVIKTSIMLSLWETASLNITDSQISIDAAISENKLNLAYNTTSLYNSITAIDGSVTNLNNFLAITGIKLSPHILGTDYKHLLSHIDIDPDASLVKINPITTGTSVGTSVVSRNTTDLKTLAEDISNNLTAHEKLDGSTGVTALTGGTVPPTDFSHTASGIYVNTDNFSSIPQSNTDVQKVVNFIDSSSLLLLGARTTNLFSNGISRHSRSTPLLIDGYGTLLVSPTPVNSYLSSTSPVDTIDGGDDVIEFFPAQDQTDGYAFDAQFTQVRPGDLLTINYDIGTSVAYQFVIDSVKSIISGGTRVYYVRINGRNIANSTTGYAQINKSVFNRNKQNALSNIRVPNSISNIFETLIVASPRGAMALGINFNPSQLNASYYKLYLCLYQNGDTSSTLVLPGIDVTGNRGITPGKYTLQSVVDSTNAAFRASGFNYRFVAFEYEGQFGIALGDHYQNSGFSIISGVVDTTGEYTGTSNAAFSKNVVDNYDSIDPLGFGSLGANVASPPPSASYPTTESATLSPTIIFTPLKKNFFYVNGAERATLYSDPLNLVNNVDIYGDGYFPATIVSAHIGTGRVNSKYQVSKDISRSGLKIGKTIVVQPAFPTSDSRFNLRDYGRFIVENVEYFNCGALDGYAYITVYDSVHGNGTSPAAVSNGIPVNIYFTNDSVAFNTLNVADDGTSVGSFKRFFENYIDKDGHTFAHERARFIADTVGDIGKINIYNISPKLKGYTLNNYKEIRFTIDYYDTDTGIYDGYLSQWDGSSYGNYGPNTSGKKGEISRFYDETNIDHIDFVFNLSDTISNFGPESIDIQLFNSLALNQEEMLLSTCQVYDLDKKITYLQDRREFGNISEEHLSSSAIRFITAVSKIMFNNRVINGFDLDPTVTNGISGSNIILSGGQALIDGRIVLVNNSITTFPILREWTDPTYNTTITWFVCANSKGQIELVADTSGGDPDRIFYVKNPNVTSPAAYPVRATVQANLQTASTSEHFRDLIALYSVDVVVTGSGTSWTIDPISAPSNLRGTFSRI